MPLGIDPTVDYAFKRLFGDPANSDLLMHLLNAVLKPLVPIVEVQVLNPFNDKEFEEDKLSILDIKARDAGRAWFNIEMQSKALNWVPQRLAYYNASLFVDQLFESDHYQELLPAITICFLKEVVFPDLRSPHLEFGLYDAQNRVYLSDSLQIHTIELPKYNYRKELFPWAEPLEKWAFFLGHAAEIEVSELKLLLPSKEYAKAMEVMEMIARTPEERQLYESRRKAERDFHTSVTDAAVAALQQGMQQGIQQGMQQGERNTLREEIHFLQGMLQEPETTSADLEILSVAELKQLCGELRNRLRAAR